MADLPRQTPVLILQAPVLILQTPVLILQTPVLILQATSLLPQALRLFGKASYVFLQFFHHAKIFIAVHLRKYSAEHTDQLLRFFLKSRKLPVIFRKFRKCHNNAGNINGIIRT